MTNRYQPIPPIHLLRTFEAAARLGSFKAAAEELHLTPPAVTQKLKQLEQNLDVCLFHRGNQKVALTDVGREYYRTCKAGLDILMQLTPPSPVLSAQTLTLSAPPFLVQQHLLPSLHEFKQQVGDLDVNIMADHNIANLHEGEADAAIRYGLGEWADLTSYPLMPLLVTPVCSPQYAEQHQLGQVEQLKACTLLHLNTATRGWTYWLQHEGVESSSDAPSITFNDYNSLIQACTNHAGVALGLRPSIDHLLQDGTLVAPFENQLPMQEAYYFVVQNHRADDALLQSLYRWVKEQIPKLN